ncbi:MAG: polysaccharide biosynthesis protein [Bacteroidales bacterium]|nr:polysaccharide biosynthesis protein [Bacteroidales bacterium]
MNNPLYRFSEWHFTHRILPYSAILALDCATVAVSGFLAAYFRLGGSGFAGNFWQIFFVMVIGVVIYAVTYVLMRTYRSVLRFSSFVDLERIGVANFLATAIIVLFHYTLGSLVSDYLLFPDAILGAFIFVLSTMVQCVMRIVAKDLYTHYHRSAATQPAFIYGCMQGGIAIGKSILNDPNGKFQLMGFVSGEQAIENSKLLGVDVYYDTDDVVDIMKRSDVKTLIVSPAQADRFTHRSSLINALVSADIKILMMPPSDEWDGYGEVSHHQFKEVEIEDLLPRDIIHVDMKSIGEMLSGKRVLITGAAGSIGSEMARQVAKFSPSDLVLVDQAETPMHDVRRYMAERHPDLKVWTIVGSINNEEHMERIFSAHKPEYVFHAAAYKHVPMMEDNPAVAVQNNVYGTRVIADLAVKCGTKKFVMISTDKAVNPTNVMGCSKRICEIYCQALNSHQKTTQFVTTRFGNVLGSNGSVIPIFREQIRKGGPVTVTHPDIIRYFMLIPEACRLVLEAGTMGNGGEIFVFDMGAPVRIADLAKNMIQLYGAKDVKIEYTGLRNGEKLFEELLSDSEQTKPTGHPKIKVAQVREYPYELALKNEIELHELSYTFDDMAIVRKMKEIVPEFRSQNSRFEALDVK